MQPSPEIPGRSRGHRPHKRSHGLTVSRAGNAAQGGHSGSSTHPPTQNAPLSGAPGSGAAVLLARGNASSSQLQVSKGRHHQQLPQHRAAGNTVRGQGSATLRCSRVAATITTISLVPTTLNTRSASCTHQRPPRSPRFGRWAPLGLFCGVVSSYAQPQPRTAWRGEARCRQGKPALSTSVGRRCFGSQLPCLVQGLVFVPSGR